jgi:hypothetical protein
MSRRPTALLLVALLALVAGCGGNDSGGGSSLGDQFGYLPKDAAIVATIETDVQGDQYRNLDRLASKFPFAGQLKNQLKQSVGQSGVDYDKDLKPLLGNPLVVGSPDAGSLVDGKAKDAFIVAWNVKDGDKFRELIKREGNSRESGKVGGETAYESNDGSVVVVKGDTLVGASDRPTLEAALNRQGGDDKLTEEQFDGAFGDLPKEALVRVYGDAQQLLEADPSTATARQVKWVAGLRTFAFTATAEQDGLAVDARVNTQGVGEQDLPLASGDESPQIARNGEFAAGLRNAQQLLRFIDTTAKALDPQFEAKKQAIGQQLGIDIDRDLIGQFTKVTSVTGALDGTWALHSEIEDPQAMAATLDKMEKAGKVGDLSFAAAGDLTEITDQGGSKLFVGIENGVLVGGPDPAAAKAVAGAQKQAVPGAKGSLVAIADGEAIVKAVLGAQGGGGALGGQFFTGPIGDLTAWVATNPDGMRARVKLKIE